MYLSIKTKNKGQGAIELIIALSIITFAIVGIISLTVMNISGQKITEDYIIASQLAREGVEVIRNLRDTDWLASDSVIRTATADFTKHYGIVRFDFTNNTWSPVFNLFADNAYEDANGSYNSDSKILLAGSPDGVYQHDAGTATPYGRIIVIDFICLNTGDCTDGICSYSELNCTDSTSDSDTYPDVIGYRVTAKVQWNSKGVLSYASSTDYLYDWR